MTEGAPAHGSVAHLLPPTYKRLIAEWLEEDTPSLDYGGFVVGEEESEAKLLGKSKVCQVVEVLSISIVVEELGEYSRGRLNAFQFPSLQSKTTSRLHT